MSIVVIGAGGFGREVMLYVKSHPKFKDLEILGFVDDGLQPNTMVNGVKVLGGLDFLLNHKNSLSVFIGIANPKIKESIVQKLAHSHHQYPILIHPSAYLIGPDTICIGMGTIIGPACILTTNILLGSFVSLNIGVTLCHDIEVGDYCTFMPNVAITGGGFVGKSSFLGTGVSIFEPMIKIEQHSRILRPA
jgi:sugar O-acyltransferase (sialic acid O-acetyltransferase NeuD family)